MTIQSKIICDSVGQNGVRLTTFVLKYPRFIHSELMTHRMFSRNASSSRAIPFNKQVQMIYDDLAIPLEFRKNQKGMQAGEAIENQDEAIQLWRKAAHDACETAAELNELGIHKQYVNRLLEPYSHISVVLSATEYSNFFALRHHHMAQPEIAELAKQMWEAYEVSTPRFLFPGEWHLPFVSQNEIHQYTELGIPQTYVDWPLLIRMSVARCARVSYLNHEGKAPSLEEDLSLYDRLLGNAPIHASPAEHQAEALTSNKEIIWSGNLRGWTQYRKTIKNENITKFDGPLK